MSRFHQALQRRADLPRLVAPEETVAVPPAGQDVAPAPLPVAVVVPHEFERARTVLPLNAPAQVTAPKRDDATPRQESSLPLRKDAVPLRKESPPVREGVAPARTEAQTLREEVPPLRAEALPLSEEVPPLRDESSPRREEPLAPWPVDIAHGRAMGEKLVIHADANPLLVDQFRKLAATLHQAQLEHGTRTVTIASTLSSEGKTLTAVNLALTLARSYGRRVLLIDGDLRGPSIHTSLDCPLAPGLTDLVTGSVEAEPPIVPLMPRLAVLTAGTRTRDPISVLSSHRFREFLATAASAFDWIVVDMPPVGALPDAALLATLSDTTILVVQAGVASYQLVQRAAETLGPERIVGVVLNMVPDGEIGATYGHTGDYRPVVAPAT